VTPVTWAKVGFDLATVLENSLVNATPYLGASWSRLSRAFSFLSLELKRVTKVEVISRVAADPLSAVVVVTLEALLLDAALALPELKLHTASVNAQARMIPDARVGFELIQAPPGLHDSIGPPESATFA
jgi:hypothetical protein